MLGTTLVSRYQITKNLGGGGFGETFVAQDTHLPGSPECVVKKLQPQAKDPVTLQTARRLFDTEAQVLYKLGNHDCIPQLLAYFEENQEFYLVQELISGNDITQEVETGEPLDQEKVIALLSEILEILDFVHQQNVIHRDINPRNILRRQDNERLVLIDFGAVKQIATQVVNPTGVTKSTVAIGTPGYIPSEQAQGNPKFSSDIYAVGIIGIQALTGTDGESLEKDPDTYEIIWQDKASVSQEFAAVLDKMVRYDFRQRYTCAKDVLQALRGLNEGNTASNTIVYAPSPKKLQNKLSALSTGLSHRLSKYRKPVNYKSIVFKTLGGLSLVSIGLVTSIFAVNRLNTANAKELYQQGNTYYELQRYQKAIAAYDRAIEIKPNYSLSWNGKGATLYELKQYEDALIAYDKAIQLQPSYLDAWKGRAFTLYKLNRYSEALASFDKVLDQENELPEVWNARGEILSNLKNYNQAIKSYDRAIELQEDYEQAWYNKGRGLHRIGRYKDAVRAYEKVIDLKVDNVSAWYNLGNALVNLKRYRDAFNAYDKTVQYQSNHYQALLSRSNMLLNLRRYEDAVESFEKYIKYQPSSYQGWYGKAWSLHQMQRYESAVKTYDKALSLRRRSYQAWYNRGNSLFNLEKYQEAAQSYTTALKYQPEHYESWLSKGNALIELESYKQAIASYQQALKLKPNDRKAKKGIKKAQKKIEEKLEAKNPKPFFRLPKVFKMRWNRGGRE